MSEIGGFQNEVGSEPASAEPTAAEAIETGGATGARLRSIIERIERLEEEKQGIADDIKEVFAEAKGDGFDVKTIRQIIRIRKKDPSDRQEEEALLETYMAALGMA